MPLWFRFILSALACLLSGSTGLAQSASSFSDEFDAAIHPWTLFESETKSASIADGTLLLKGKSNALPVLTTIELPGIQQDSFELEVSVYQFDGKKNMGYGLYWGGRPDNLDYHVLLISSNQKFTILRMERGQYRQILPWTATPIVLGPKQWNKLGVKRRGNRYDYFINDQIVFSGPADATKGPLTGVILHGTMELAIDAFSLDSP